MGQGDAGTGKLRIHSHGGVMLCNLEKVCPSPDGDPPATAFRIIHILVPKMPGGPLFLGFFLNCYNHSPTHPETNKDLAPQTNSHGVRNE